jgi:hypothetical protein
LRRHTAARRWLWPGDAGGQPGFVAIALDHNGYLWLFHAIPFTMAIYGYLWLFIYGYLLDGMAITF